MSTGYAAPQSPSSPHVRDSRSSATPGSPGGQGSRSPRSAGGFVPPQASFLRKPTPVQSLRGSEEEESRYLLPSSTPRRTSTHRSGTPSSSSSHKSISEKVCVCPGRRMDWADSSFGVVAVPAGARPRGVGRGCVVRGAGRRAARSAPRPHGSPHLYRPRIAERRLHGRPGAVHPRAFVSLVFRPSSSSPCLLFLCAPPPCLVC